MKKSLIVVLAGIALFAALAGTASAAPGPVIYEQARAIPTRSGKNVRITLYTKRVTRLKVSVNASRRMKAVRFGAGCGKLRCQKWKVYAVRTGEECHRVELRAKGRLAGSRASAVLTACEPFRGGNA
jgi:hypothetical protein